MSLKNFTSESAKESQKKAVRKRFENKLIKESIQKELSVIPEGQTITIQDAIVKALIERCLRGDVRAIELLRDTIGQKPIDKIAEKVTKKVTVVWKDESVTREVES